VISSPYAVSSLEIDAMFHKTEKPLRFLHIGDLHLTDAGLQNHVDLCRIVDEINGNTGGKIDFVYLPGDNADDGTPEQFRIVHNELSRLIAPWHAIPGDHDFKPRSLDNFYRGLHVRRLPYVDEISGCRCVFLDVVSRGTGGPDFRLGAARLVWLRGQLDAAKRDGKTAVVFMHAYPADLGEEAVEIAAMIDESPVALVSMGHTHYNEISNDGRTIYAATRSTGQIEEGGVGFAFASITRRRELALQDTRIVMAVRHDHVAGRQTARDRAAFRRGKRLQRSQSLDLGRRTNRASRIQDRR
jgi:3',5'-cyclic-AMP phosphodiesterase